jgi:hypothetical protein
MLRELNPVFGYSSKGDKLCGGSRKMYSYTSGEAVTDGKINIYVKNLMSFP